MSNLFKKWKGAHVIPKKHKIEKRAKERRAEEAEKDADLLMPDDERLRMEAMRKAARRTGGRQSTILTGKIGGAASVPFVPSGRGVGGGGNGGGGGGGGGGGRGRRDRRDRGRGRR